MPVASFRLRSTLRLAAAGAMACGMPCASADEARELAALSLDDLVRMQEPEQLAWLREAGCDFVQGYLLARPLPFSTLAARIKPAQATPA